MRKDRFVLAALAIVVVFGEVGHHLYEHHLLQRGVADVAQIRQQQQRQQKLRGAGLDVGQGYGEQAAASAIAAAAGAVAGATTPATAPTAAHDQIALMQGELDRLKQEKEDGKAAVEALKAKAKRQEESLAAAAITSTKANAEGSPPLAALGADGCREGGMFFGEDIQGSDISDGEAASPRDCCQRCARHQRGGGECTGWSFAHKDGGTPGQCYLKSATEPRQGNDGVTSGSYACCDAFDPPAPQLAATSGSAAAAIVTEDASAAEMCTMTAWWGGVRVKGTYFHTFSRDLVQIPLFFCDLTTK